MQNTLWVMHMPSKYRPTSWCQIIIWNDSQCWSAQSLDLENKEIFFLTMRLRIFIDLQLGNYTNLLNFESGVFVCLVNFGTVKIYMHLKVWGVLSNNKLNQQVSAFFKNF
jgi:hypothetical protein